MSDFFPNIIWSNIINLLEIFVRLTIYFLSCMFYLFSLVFKGEYVDVCYGMFIFVNELIGKST